MRIGIFIILAVIILGGLLYFFSPKPQVKPREQQDTPGTTSNPVPTDTSEKAVSLVIKNGEVVSEHKVISLIEGDTVLITVTNDADDELHIHGYDTEVVLKKDLPSQVTLTASLSGRFPIELHEADVEVAALEVQPK
jgi:hypothetical protein